MSEAIGVLPTDEAETVEEGQGGDLMQMRDVAWQSKSLSAERVDFRFSGQWHRGMSWTGRIKAVIHIVVLIVNRRWDGECGDGYAGAVRVLDRT